MKLQIKRLNNDGDAILYIGDGGAQLGYCDRADLNDLATQLYERGYSPKLADPQPKIDDAPSISERILRATEQQANATERLATSADLIATYIGMSPKGTYDKATWGDLKKAQAMDGVENLSPDYPCPIRKLIVSKSEAFEAGPCVVLEFATYEEAAVYFTRQPYGRKP